jgi:hypothetical protein
MASKKKQTSVEQLKARMSAAVDHASDDLYNESGGFDVHLAPRSFWKKNWDDKKVQKMFIENFIRIASKHSDNEVIPLKLNDIQNDYHFNRTRRNAVLKSRQQGLSTYELALNFSTAILFSGRNVRLVPHDPDAEEEFWQRLNIMYDNLPSKLQPTTKYKSKEKFQFHDLAKGVTNSVITSLNPRPGQENKLRSQTLTAVHATEIPFWVGEQEKVFTALMSAAEKGTITLESTAGGKEKFYFYYQQGKKKKGGWTSHFYEWFWLRENRIEGYRFAKLNDKFVLLEPGESILDVWNYEAKTEDERIENNRRFDDRAVSDKEIEACERILAHLKKLKYVDSREESWHIFEVAEYLAWRRLKIEEFGGVDKERGLKTFLVEHPENDIDCFEGTGKTVISPLYLKVTCEPQAFAIEGREYIIGADTSLGTDSGDYSAIEILDLQTGRQVHSEKLKIAPDLLAFHLVELSDLYNFATMAVERNNTGIATLKKLGELVSDTDRIFKELTVAQRRQVEDGKKTYEEALDECEFGIVTTTANKSLFGIFLERAVRNGEIGLSSQEWCDEAQNVIWLDNGRTKFGAMTGFHDDKFIALAIANYARETRIGQFFGSGEYLPETGTAR